MKCLFKFSSSSCFETSRIQKYCGIMWKCPYQHLPGKICWKFNVCFKTLNFQQTKKKKTKKKIHIIHSCPMLYILIQKHHIDFHILWEHFKYFLITTGQPTGLPKIEGFMLRMLYWVKFAENLRFESFHPTNGKMFDI